MQGDLTCTQFPRAFFRGASLTPPREPSLCQWIVHELTRMATACLLPLLAQLRGQYLLQAVRNIHAECLALGACGRPPSDPESPRKAPYCDSNSFFVRLQRPSRPRPRLGHLQCSSGAGLPQESCLPVTLRSVLVGCSTSTKSCPTGPRLHNRCAPCTRDPMKPSCGGQGKAN